MPLEPRRGFHSPPKSHGEYAAPEESIEQRAYIVMISYDTFLDGGAFNHG